MSEPKLSYSSFASLESSTVEMTLAKTVTQKLRRRIHLPPDIYADTVEERFICTGILVKKHWLESYSYKTGWTVCWLDSCYAVKNADKVEVILRRHKKLGAFILFRIWKEGVGS